MHQWILSGLSLVLLTGLNSFGPVNQGNYQQLAEAQLPTDAGQVLASEPGAWANNANGFADIRSQQAPLLGVLLITTKGIYFQQWLEAEQRYDTMLTVSLRDITAIREEKFGRSVRIVFKKSDLTVTSLSVMTGSGGVIDRDKTHVWFELLRTRIGPV
ncbi:hypothetical protein [Pseudoxanthomonas sp. CF125]|uniref:hypothetical protein n=1 Tax=Pseudoxanthomonas sp. CF125 TaxID=1855303 RepID=UPI00087E89AF|nr:hypothetical protein [Pseudoxanthomonas sp. CF125]SDR10685.1 hypothetical protein SAMN05216569_3125 [Pseudoxanthomonas sp. CF125]